ncbi:hypothetical protein ACOME3_006221 [Neoechinorhynchus agilis]
MTWKIVVFVWLFVVAITTDIFDRNCLLFPFDQPTASFICNVFFKIEIGLRYSKMNFPSEVLAEYVIDMFSSHDRMDISSVDMTRMLHTLESSQRETPSYLLTNQSINDLFDALKRVLQDFPVSHISDQREHIVRHEMLNVIRWMTESNIIRNGTLLGPCLEVLLTFIRSDNDVNGVMACQVLADYVSTYLHHLRNNMNISGFRFWDECLHLFINTLRSFVDTCSEKIKFCRTLAAQPNRTLSVSLSTLERECPIRLTLACSNLNTKFIPAAQCSFRLTEQIFITIGKFAEVAGHLLRGKTNDIISLLTTLIPLLNEVTPIGGDTGDSNDSDRLEVYRPDQMIITVECLRVKYRATQLLSILMKLVVVSIEHSRGNNDHLSLLHFIHNNTTQLLKECPKIRTGILLHRQICGSLRHTTFWQMASSVSVGDRLGDLITGAQHQTQSGLLYIGHTTCALAASRTAVNCSLLELVRANKAFLVRRDILVFLRLVSLDVLDWTMPSKAHILLLNTVHCIADHLKVHIAHTAVPAQQAVSPFQAAAESERNAGSIIGRQRFVLGRLLEIVYVAMKRLCDGAKKNQQCQLSEEKKDLFELIRLLDSTRTNYHSYVNHEFDLHFNEACRAFEKLCQITHVTCECLINSSLSSGMTAQFASSLNDMTIDEFGILSNIMITMFDGIQVFSNLAPYSSVQISHEYDALIKQFKLHVYKKDALQQPPNILPQLNVKPTTTMDDIPSCALKDSLRLFSPAYTRLISRNLIDRIARRHGPMTSIDHLVLHLIKLLVESPPHLTLTFASELLRRLVQLKEFGEFEVCVVLQILRSLNAIDIDRQVLTDILKDYFDTLFELLFRCSLNLKFDYMYVWVELMNLARPSGKPDWFTDEMGKRVSRICDLLTHYSTGRHAQDIAEFLNLTCLLAPCAIGHHQSLVQFISQAIYRCALNPRTTHRAICAFSQMSENAVLNSINLVTGRLVQGFLHALVRDCYLVPSNDASRAILISLAKLGSGIRRSHRLQGFATNTLNMDSIEPRRQRLYDNGIVLEFNVLIDNERAGKIFLPAQLLVAESIKLMSQDLCFDDNDATTEYLCEYAYRILRSCTLNQFSAFADIGLSDLRSMKYDAGPIYHEFVAYLIFGLMVSKQCPKINRRLALDVEWLLRCVLKIVVFSSLRLQKGLGYFPVLMDALKRGLCSLNRNTNSSAVETFAITLDLVLEQRIVTSFDGFFHRCTFGH